MSGASVLPGSLAGLLLAAAVLVVRPVGSRRRVARLVQRTGPGGAAADTDGRDRSGGGRRRGAAPRVRALVRARPTGALAAARRAVLVEICRAVASELRAGRPPDTALVVAVEPLLAPGAVAAPLRAELRPLLMAARTGAPVAPVLRALAPAPGAEAARSLALCWQVAGQSGSGLAAAVERVADGAAADAALHRQLAAELAAPRATARLLAVLPLLGVLLGTALGAQPLTLLLTTPLGLGCLVLGGALTALGAWWAGRIVRSVLRP
ncbi:MAG TPA: type II secretion system F family protein [Motilibacteraceae bacterium]|nr:type II secretion system F family protein [Motilibacteraceae bacterium]